MEASLAGVPLLASKNVTWALTAGVAPPMKEFDVIPNRLDELLQRGGFDQSVNLLYNDEGEVHEFEELHIITNVPADNVNIASVQVTDKRWVWGTKHILRRYNMRRKVGTRRRGEWGDELQSANVDDAFQYAFFSLNPETRQPWTVEEILTDLLLSTDALDEDAIFLTAEFLALKELPVEDLVLDDPGPAALQRVLTLIPGAEVTIDKDGLIRFFSTLSGKEGVVLDQSGPEVFGGGHVEFITNEFTRPKAIDVFFTIESEVRFDFLGDDFLETTDLTDPTRFAENVLPVPDFNGITVNGEFFAQGTYVTIQQALDGWGPAPIFGRITIQDLNRAFIPGNQVFAALGILGQLEVDGEDANWSARIAALMQHYRQTFRINRQWIDRVLGFKAYLVGTIDVVSGQRAPALAFADHAIKPAQKGQFRNLAAGQDAYFAWNVDGYPGKDVEFRDTTKPAPAKVQILDSDQGIFRIAYELDPYELSSQIFPAKLTNSDDQSKESGGPVSNKRRSNQSKPIGFNIKAQNGTLPALSNEQRAAIVVTAVPAAPNTKQQLYRLRVTPDDIRGLLPQAASAGLSNAKGPIRQVRVGANVETCRVRWKQSASRTIAKIFGVGGQLSNPREELRDLVVNEELENVASLHGIARAVAASIYAEEHDRFLGQMTARMISDIKMDGSIKELVFEKRPDGKVFTIIGLPPEVPALSVFAFMKPSDRQAILRTVLPFD